MRYTHMFHSPPSPSDAGLIKGKAASLSIQKPRLPKSRHHHIRKASQSTGASSILSLEKPLPVKQEEHPTHEVKAVAYPVAPIKETIVEVDAEAEAVKAAPPSQTPSKKPGLPQIKQWDSYLHWLCLTEEPGTLWTAALCAAFRDCLMTDTTYPAAATAAESAARIDDIYWSFYLPLDPLLSHMEDRILSGYLLHVWTMFIELGKRIPYDDEGQDRLVELLKELVRLPPMEVRTWEGNDAPWSDLPTLDDALLSAWDELYDPENQSSQSENTWLNYFAFLGRLVAAEVTPEWWEIPGTTLKEVMAEQNQSSNLTRHKAMAVAEFMNQAGDAFFEWCMDAGVLDVKKDLDVIVPLTESPTRLDWFENRKMNFTREEIEKLGV